MNGQMIVTRYGNKFSQEEWEQKEAIHKAEANENNVYFDKIAGMEKYLRRQLAEMGLDRRTINIIAGLFVNDKWEDANIQFSSAERKVKLNDLRSRWNKAVSRL